MLIKIILVLLVVFAIIAIQTEKLNRAVIYFASFSLFASLAYLLYSAPDVAIAEAVIGSTLATIMYLIALNKYNVFKICCCAKNENETLNHVKKYCRIHELEPDIISESSSERDAFLSGKYDLVIEENDGKVTVYGKSENYHIDGIEEYLDENSKNSDAIKIKRM